ncbi:archaellar assembly protein FlaJ [Salarchaeum japonicum]|uniref:Archaellar assembly protein FlaJ n=1 Tax=Salarchaeum japonicum TaxID=555573 RepID=A0AAV3T0P5_9EURY|nr:archaellar assembly protein FlaJ [Salarchaeum japonicum]
MATETGTGTQVGADDDEFDIGNVVRSLLRDYEYMGMPAQRYALVVILPSVVLGFAVMLLPFFLGLPLFVVPVTVLFGLFLPLVALIYPKILQDRKRKQIREHFHLFITHITILSTTNIDRVEVFRTLAKEDEYEAIAEEMGHIVGLIDTWNQSLEDACRMRAKRVPSPLMQDFLERLAYTVGAGQTIDDFLLSEQDSIIQSFVTRYEAQLDRLALIKDVYMSIVLSTTFGLVFALVVPFIVGIDPMTPVMAVILLYLFLQVVFVYAMNSVAPKDPVWFYRTEIALDRNARLRTGLLVGTGLSLALTALTYGILSGLVPVGNDIPLPLFLAVPFTPFIIPGLIARQEQNRIKNRDESFPSFIRALGAVESVKQSSTGSVLQSLRKKDFGNLTTNVDDLYKRLSMRIDSNLAWRYFAAETGSYLIQKFSDMYVTGRRMGGEPRQLGSLIEANISEVLNLRRKRSQEAGTVVGTIYGITGASVFAMFVGLEISRLFMTIAQDMDLSNAQLGGLLSVSQYDIPQLQFMLFVIVLLNALLTSVMIRIVSRGHSLTTLTHFVVQVWISAVVAVATGYLVGALVSV